MVRLFLRLLYVAASILIGFIVFYASWISAIYNNQVELGNEALAEENYEFFLRFSKYHKEEPVYVFEADGDFGVKFLIHEVYADNPLNDHELEVGLSFFIHHLGPEVAISGSDKEESAIRLYFDSGENEDYIIEAYVYEYLTFVSRNVFVSSMTEQGTIITRIELVDYDGETYFDTDDDHLFVPLDLTALTLFVVNTIEEDTDLESFLATHGLIAGYSDSEAREFTFPPSEMPKVYRNIIVFVMVFAVFTWYVFFRRKKHLGKKPPTRGFTHGSFKDELTALEKIDERDDIDTPKK